MRIQLTHFVVRGVATNNFIFISCFVVAAAAALLFCVFCAVSIHNSKFVIHLVEFIKSKPIIGCDEDEEREKKRTTTTTTQEKSHAYESMLNVFEITLTVF